MVVRVLSIVCVISQSFGVGIVPRLFFWIHDSVRKILKIFESCSQSAKLVGELDHPVH